MENIVAKCLLEIKSVFFGFDHEYIGSKGQRMPVYCDNRLILSYPRARRAVTNWLIDAVKTHFPSVEMVMGTAPNGISFATLISEHLDLPMGYVLESKKDHAFKNRVEGLIRPGMKVLIVDDVIFSGDKLIDVTDVLRAEGVEVLGAVCIVSYELASTKQKFEQKNIDYISLTNYDVINLVGMQAGKISYEQFQKTLKFKENPQLHTWLE